MKNLYDNQNFWIGQVNKAKHIGIPNHCVWTGDWNRIVTNRITIINKFIPIHESILDAGCGFGWLSQEIKHDYTGVDQTTALINYGKELYPNTNLVLSKLQELPFEDNSFDWVVSSCVKHGIVECEELGEIESGRWNQIEEELLRIAKKGIIWPSYSNEYEFIER
tara:strand:- start:2358 stop:2852 length:495 start_codon:yes stop_codon:yes gene_type:complete